MTTTDYTRQTRSDYAERLDALGVEYPAKATKRDLYELLMRTLRDEIENITGEGGVPLRLADADDAQRQVIDRTSPRVPDGCTGRWVGDADDGFVACSDARCPVHTSEATRLEPSSPVDRLPLPAGCTGHWRLDGATARITHETGDGTDLDPGSDQIDDCPVHEGMIENADGSYAGVVMATPVSQEVVPVNDIPTVGRWEQMRAMAVELAASRLLRPALQGRWEDVLLILLTGHDLGISSTMALSKIHVIEGVPSAGAELQLALVRRAGHRVTGDVDPDLRWASISGTRADTGETMNVVYKLDEAVAAGRCTITAEGKVRSRSASGKVKPWEASTSDMLWARAVTRLCRRHFADVIGGLSYTPEELGVIDVEGEEVAPVVDHTPLREDCNGAQDGSEHDDDGLCCKVRIAERVQALPGEARAKLRAAWAEETKRGNMPTLKGMDRGAVARAGALIEAAEREALPAQAEVVDRPSDPAEVEHEEADVVEPEGAS